MRKARILILLLFLVPVLKECKPSASCTRILNNMSREFDAGNFLVVHRLADSVYKSCASDFSVVRKADSLTQLADRTEIDFCLTEEEVKDRIRSRYGSFSPAELSKWEEEGWLEYRIINGEKMYFRRTVSNLFLLKRSHEEKEGGDKEVTDPKMVSRLKNTSAAFSLSRNQHEPVLPVKMKVTYTITVHPGAVPDGERIRCWMPWPKSGHSRQTDIELLGTSSPEYLISPDSAIHSTIYMEETAHGGSPVRFIISFKYQSKAQYFNLAELMEHPYDRNSELYRKYTSEQPPQIIFGQKTRQLADSLTDPGDDPAETVRKIYMWFKKNITWTGALEYSIMPDIPAYVLKNRRGDCGMQTFLYISMLRYKGIPVRWQSGWMVPPHYENLHDWAEVYFEGTGWVPSDISYDLQKSGDKGIREYFLSGIDSYRLIVNDGVSGPERRA